MGGKERVNLKDRKSLLMSTEHIRCKRIDGNCGCSKHGNSRFTVRGNRRMERQYGGSLHDDIPMPTKQFCLLAECIDLTNISRLSNGPIRTFQQRYHSDYCISMLYLRYVYPCYIHSPFLIYSI